MENNLEQAQVQQQRKFSNPALIITAIIISAWIIAMGILGAGYLISKEISKGNAEAERSRQLAAVGVSNVNAPIDVKVTPEMFVQGNADAKVTIIEFADFQCPFCGQFHSETYKPLKQQYIDSGKVKFVYADFAFLGEESFKASEAARCAADQSKFWEYHDKLFESQAGENAGGFADIKLKQFAKELALDSNTFDKCLDARIHKPIVESAVAQAANYGVTSTPTLFINGLKFEGVLPLTSLQQIIETELAK